MRRLAPRQRPRDPALDTMRTPADRNVQIAVAFIDEQRAHTWNPHFESTAFVDTATRPVVVGQAYPDLCFQGLEPGQREVQTVLSESLRNESADP
jgi:hypothetical protein